MGGSNVAFKSGTYGTQGTAAPGNLPGERYGAVTWTDAAANLWLFGGYGSDSAGTVNELNDLWKYEP
jgi:N-acetylneuraminic acid mutarotase